MPSPGSAKLASIPVLALLRDSAELLTLPALVAVVIAAVVGGRVPRLLAAGAAAWVAIVAVMTVAGYAGNPRYLVAAAAVAAALAGIGATARFPRAGAAVLVAAVLAFTAGDLSDQVSELGSRADASAEFDGVLAAAGGKDALLRCSRIRTSNRARSLVAWRLDLPMRDLDAAPVRPAVVIRSKWFYGLGLEPPRDPGYQTLTTTPYWQIVAACGRAPQVEPSVSLSR